MTITEALTAIDTATAAARDAAQAVAVSGRQAGFAPAQKLIQNLLVLEQGAAKIIAQVAGRPLPAPAPEKVGLWTQETRSALQDFGDTPVPDGIGGAAQKLTDDANALLSWAKSAPQQVPQRPQPEAAPMQGIPQDAPPPVAAAPPVVAPPVTPEPPKSQRVVGGLLLGSSLLGAGLAAFLAWRHDQKIAKTGVNPADPRRPPKSADEAQAILDSELPGARISMARAPDGDWVASVHRGGDILSRKIEKAPENAASSAVREAIDRQAPPGSPFDIEDAVVIAPAKKRVEKRQNAEKEKEV